MNYKIKTATGPVLFYLKITGFRGWTSLWNTIYIYPGYENNTKLIAHEVCHLNQMATEGRLRFMIKYTYYLLKYGYINNPYEIEARKYASSNT